MWVLGEALLGDYGREGGDLCSVLLAAGVSGLSQVFMLYRTADDEKLWIL